MTPTRHGPDAVTAYRPTDTQIDEEWPAAARVALCERILATPRPFTAARPIPLPGRRWHPRRWAVPAALVAAAATVLLIVQAVLPSGTPAGPSAAAAATLEQLATTAQTAPADLVQPGQYRYLLDKASVGETLESWTSYSGETWRRDSYYNGAVLYFRFAAGTNDLDNPSPQFLTTLPTDPGKLRTYLRAHVTGSTSKDEAIFVWVGDTLRLGYTPPALRAAAIRVLKRTPHITVQSARDKVGRQTVQVTFIDNTNRPDESQSLFLDPATSELLQEQDTARGGTFTATYTESSVVARVPAVVIAGAAKPNTAPPPPPLPAGSVGGAASASSTVTPTAAPPK